MTKIRILLAEDHTIVRMGLRSLLEVQTNFEVVGEAADGREALAEVERLLPDVVLMDSTMPILNGLEATRQICKRFPQVKVLVLTMHTNEEYIFQFLQAGAAGYLVKQTDPQELIAAIQAVHRGDCFLSPMISRTIVDEYIRHVKPADKEDSYEQLTDREREVLQLVVEGFSNREIAEQLHISLKTAGAHRVNLMHKLNIHSLTELTRYAIRKGIIGVEP
ncbi:MAG: response regulator transcription factor [Chloroflexota bacterium]